MNAMTQKNEQIKEVNRDVFNLICDEKGKTVFKQIDIPKSTAILAKLQAMIDNDNETVLDMQSEFCIVFDPKLSLKGFNYITPFSYTDSYVNMPSYPELVSWTEYQEMKTTKVAELKKGYDNIYGAGQPRISRQDYVNQNVLEYEKSLKKSFWSIAERYIQAYDYHKIVSRFSNLPEVRMYSTDMIGWRRFDYKITEDISIVVGTNFGYGSSSYFNLVVYYKGIEIAPYSYIVRYYNVNWMNIYRYTRAYYPRRDNWNTAFQFVESVANMACSDQMSFVESFIKKEVNEMMSGLRQILYDDTEYLERLINVKNTDLINVWNISAVEKRRYEIYPIEFLLVTKVEKITGALVFLENLNALSSIFNEIESSVTEIKEMAKQVIPEIIQGEEKVDEELSKIRAELAAMQFEYDTYLKAIASHEDVLNGLCENKSVEEQSNLKAEYDITHPEYKELKTKRDRVACKISDLKVKYADRDSFLSILKESLKRVEDAGLLAANVA